ncbi:MAG TPA: uroporphyrinogen-III C-methyltransferase [Bacillota bacterium]
MGKVYLVGAGPGDIDLITVKGLKCIQDADVILYDRLINKELLDYAKQGAEFIYCGKLPKYHAFIQETINYFLVKYAKQGKIVTRLKGGDPFVFGRGAEEAQVLVEHEIAFEVVPGITSGIAAPAYAGIPVTHREISSSFAIVTGHMRAGKHDSIDWESLAKGVDTLAIYMGVGNLSYICNQLVKYGKPADTPVALVHWGTTEAQHTVTGSLASIVEIAKKAKIKNPSMIIVGEVVHLREKINWFEHARLDETVMEKVFV